jgi:pimeloyl-ACP methyl ester carboxylesterase
MAALKLRGRLKELKMPVLVVGGDRDEVVGVDNILAEYQALPAATRSLHIFHSVGHSPNVELAERFAGTLKRFINGLNEP